MRHLAFLLLFLAIGAHADTSFYGPGVSSVNSLSEGTTTTAANTSEQTLIELVGVSKNMVIDSVQMDMTAAATLTAMQFRVYRKRQSGSYILLGTGSNLTGLLTWTLASSSKGMEGLSWDVVLNAGDSFKFTGQQTVVGASFAIPYTVMAFQ